MIVPSLVLIVKGFLFSIFEYFFVLQTGVFILIIFILMSVILINSILDNLIIISRGKSLDDRAYELLRP